MKISPTAAFAAGAVAALVLGSGTAVAATGGKFILGKANSASTPTKLTNARGTALQLTSKAGTPPLKVSNATKVPNLNADRLDGVDSSSFALAGGQTNTVQGVSFPVDFNGDAVDDALVSVATCPSGTKLTGGGGDDYTNDGTLVLNSPADRQSWFVASTSTDLTVPSDVVAYAVCYNPRGAVSGGAFRTARSAPGQGAVDVVKGKLARKFD